MSEPSAPAGWYTDPSDDTRRRFWDGEKWTQETAPRFAPPTPETAQPTTSEQTEKPPGWTPTRLLLLVSGVLIVIGLVIGFRHVGGVDINGNPYHCGSAFVAAAGSSGTHCDSVRRVPLITGLGFVGFGITVGVIAIATYRRPQ